MRSLRFIGLMVAWGCGVGALVGGAFGALIGSWADAMTSDASSEFGQVVLLGAGVGLGLGLVGGMVSGAIGSLVLAAGGGTTTVGWLAGLAVGIPIAATGLVGEGKLLVLSLPLASITGLSAGVVTGWRASVGWADEAPSE